MKTGIRTFLSTGMASLSVLVARYSRCRKSLLRATLPTIALALSGATAHAQFTQIITLDDPLAASGSFFGTYANAIAGNTIIGFYFDSKGDMHGFLYNIANKTYSTLDDNLAPSIPGYGTNLQDISGNVIVGYYIDSNSNAQGFWYNLATSPSMPTRIFTPIYYPSPTISNKPSSIRNHGGTEIGGISGSTVFGDFVDDSGVTHCFLYDIAHKTYSSPFDYPAASAYWGGTAAEDIDGNNLVGEYVDSNNNVRGYLYNLATKNATSIDFPLATYTVATGVSGNYVVGFYHDISAKIHGYLYNIVTLAFTSFDDPLGTLGYTYGVKVSGSNVVGNYRDGKGAHGFLLTTTPTILSFSPTSGPPGTSVTITCSNFPTFTQATAVKIGTLSAGFSTLSDDPSLGVGVRTIAFVVPAGASTGNISIVNPFGSGTSSATFTVTH